MNTTQMKVYLSDGRCIIGYVLYLPMKKDKPVLVLRNFDGQLFDYKLAAAMTPPSYLTYPI